MEKIKNQGSKFENGNWLIAIGILVIGIVFIVALIISFFDAAISANASSYSGNLSDYTNLGEYIIKTDEANAIIPLSKSQLKTAIDKVYSGQSHDNYIDNLDAFIEIQDKYKVNAAFAVAVAQTESSGGTNWDFISPSTYNWYSIQGSIGGRIC